MSEPRMLLGGAALALLIVGWVLFQGCRNATAPSGAMLTHPGESDPRAITSPSQPAAPPKSAPPASPTPASAMSPPTTAATPETSADLMVHVVGAVQKPGVYLLAPKARLRDALCAAGGPKRGADLEAVNLASFVQDGEQIRVPSLAERRAAQAAAALRFRPVRSSRSPSPPRPTRTTARYPLSIAAPRAAGQAAGPAGAPADGPVNINTAGPEELDTLPGVGPSTAAAILAFRREHGPFQSVDDLLQVRGIGEKKLAAMRDRVIVK